VLRFVTIRLQILETQDLVFLAVKSPQLLEIAETLTPILNDTTVVLKTYKKRKLYHLNPSYIRGCPLAKRISVVVLSKLQRTSVLF
jgi:hypothetical protein